MQLSLHPLKPCDETLRLYNEKVGRDVSGGVFIGAGRRAQHSIPQLETKETLRGWRGDEPGLVVYRYPDRRSGAFGGWM